MFWQAIYLTSVTQGGNVMQVANYLWTRLFDDRFSVYVSWSQDCNSGTELREMGKGGHLKKFIALRSFSAEICCLMNLVNRRRCVLSGRKIPSTFLTNGAFTAARKQAVERYKRAVKKGPGERIDFAKLTDDNTSPADGYITAGNMEDDLAEFPDRLYEYHVSNFSIIHSTLFLIYHPYLRGKTFLSVESRVPCVPFDRKQHRKTKRASAIAQ
jgi:hypothetical protein